MEHDIAHKSVNVRSRVLNRIFTRQREAVTEGGTKVHSEQQKKWHSSQNVIRMVKWVGYVEGMERERERYTSAKP